MSDQLAPVEQGNPQQQTQVTPDPQGDYKARFDGAIKKIEQLTLRARELEAQLAAKSSEIEQLTSQLGIKDVEKTVAVGERDKNLQVALQENSTLKARVQELEGLALKVKIAKELGRPELIKIADRIPALTDEKVLKEVMSDLLGFADDMVKGREQQILAGWTPPTGPVGGGKTTPASKQSWEDHINSLPLGSKERSRAMDDYYEWLAATNK